MPVAIFTTFNTSFAAVNTCLRSEISSGSAYSDYFVLI